MTRKDYKLIAEAVKDAVEVTADSDPTRDFTQGHREAASFIGRMLADSLKRDNPRFRYDRFYSACGLSEWGRVPEADPNTLVAH